MIVVIYSHFAVACHKLGSENISFSTSPSNKAVAKKGSHLVLSCMVNGTPHDTPPIWCKLNGSGDCVAVNSTRNGRENCTWISTVEILVSDQTIGQYQCSHHDMTRQVEVTAENEKGKNKM